MEKDEQEGRVVPGCRAYWYYCDHEDDQGWGCGYRCCQMLVHQHRALRGEGDDGTVPSISDIISAVNTQIETEPPSSDDAATSALTPLKWGEWMSLEHIIHYFRSIAKRTGAAAAFEYFIFERLDRRAALVDKLQDHLNRHRSLIIAEGTGMLFCIGGVEHRPLRNRADARETYVYILDPHGPPSTWREDEEGSRDRTKPPAFRFKGGVGWIALDRLLFGTCLEEFFAAFPEKKPQEDAASVIHSTDRKDEALDSLYTDVLEVCGGWRFLFIHPYPQGS